MAGFDAVVVVDWSSAATPTTGKDSIWWALHRVGDAAETRLENPATRAAAEAQLLDLLRDEIAAGRRVLIGFDFPFGYPEGFADAAFGPGAWRAVWAGLSETVQERPGNVNTRFAAAAEINRRIGAWIDAHPEQWFWLHRRWRNTPPPAPTSAPTSAPPPAP
ncbi:MAG: hypothetical protein AAFZ09_21255 [Pseudomonadota bacterium]